MLSTLLWTIAGACGTMALVVIADAWHDAWAEIREIAKETRADARERLDAHSDERRPQ